MKLVLLFHFVVLIFYSINTSVAEEIDLKCGQNATVQESGYNCQTCELLTVRCAEVHKRQCYCKPGYVKRNKSDNDCVAYDDCPEPEIHCGENEVVRDKGFDCQTCRNYQLVRCALNNERGCYCLDGYVRNDNNVCTKTSDCPSH